MNVAKLSLSTRMAINDNFGFPKGENGTIGAFVKVSKNIDKELKDLGASIQGLMQGQTTGELFTIRFPINSLDKISEIDGLVYLDIGEKLTMETPKRNQPMDNDLLDKQYQDAINQQNALNQKNNLTKKYVFNQDYEAKGTNPIDNSRTDQRSYKLKHQFKKGDVFDGSKIEIGSNQNSTKSQFIIEINSDYHNLNEDGSFSNLKGIFQVPETVVNEQTFLQKHKNHILIVGALVLGYFAYKKFNK